jgi:heme-degrading monooxygenase HmoA
MDARVVQVDGGSGDGGAQFVRDRVVPSLADDDGFEGMLHVVDRDSGRGYSVTFWRDSGALEATNPAAAQLRDEAQGEGYDVSLVGQFHVDPCEASGDPQLARVVRFSGGPDLGEFIRDTVSSTYGGVDGYLGVIGLRADDGNGIGISLWANEQAFEAAGDAMREVGQSMEEAGYQRDSLERLAVERAQLPSS